MRRYLPDCHGLAVCLLIPWLLSSASSPASPTAPLPDAHKWEIAEVFSSADGSVQFIEWFNTDPDEEVLSLESVSTQSGSSFNFPANLPSANTANRRFLMATAAFAALPGAPAPDYIMPAGFIRVAGDTIVYSGGDSVTFGALPTDGVTSIDRLGNPQVNSPQNFANATGSVNAAGSPATFSTFGAGCPNGPGGLSMILNGSPPQLGGTFTVTFTQRPSPVVLAQMGLSTRFGLGVLGTPALPWDLSALGMPGCELLVSAELGSFFLGDGVLSLAIPNLPAFTGLPLNVQGVSEAPGANPLGFIISNAGTGVVGS